MEVEGGAPLFRFLAKISGSIAAAEPLVAGDTLPCCEL
jgi:hypothetical protein